ncbi:MAG: hypothetical protein GF375_01860 [Candidatus Omnitrophica bacterium]|nr:hypothetical protein [Candidatus Omnitrophota bacterium]MBD3268871.1 hypothetical protein [Candidatus Omnitrophota bacterium]
MPNGNRMNLNVRRVPKNPDLFEFTISAPLLRVQFHLPRNIVNELRISLEKLLLGKKK